MIRRSASSSSTGIDVISIRSLDAASSTRSIALSGRKRSADVAVRQHRRRDQRRVQDRHLVMDLVALAQPAQDRDRVLDRRLADEDRLEAPLQRRVLLDVLAVLVERRRADRVQLAARQHRLEHVGGVHRALRRPAPTTVCSSSMKRMICALGVLDFLEHRLQPLLELAAELGAGDQRAHVERDDPLVLQPLRHVAADDPLGQPLDDRRLADARLADQDRVVLGPAREDLDDAPDLLVAADHRVELALPGQLGQVAAVLLERLVRRLRVRARHALRCRGSPSAPLSLVARQPVPRQQLLRRRAGTLERCRAAGARC